MKKYNPLWLYFSFFYMNRRSRRSRLKRGGAPNPFASVKAIKNGGSLNFRRRRRKLDLSNWSGWILLVLELALVIGLGYVVADSFGIKASVIGNSMSPVIEDGNVVLLNRLSTRFFAPGKGDIIAFMPQGSEDASISVKRIVAEPSDSVRIENGALYINGELYSGTTRYDYIDDAGVAENEITLPEDEYFVLGDNVNNSQDSRHESVGNVSRADIRGTVWWNLSRFALVY